MCSLHTLTFNHIDFLQLEPIGSRPPTFSTESKGSIFVKATNSSFALLCQAQAWPVGVFKWVEHYIYYV